MNKTSLVPYLTLAALFAGGCDLTGNDLYLTPSRKANGLIVILPGIEGESPLNQDIRRGLDTTDSQMALPIHRWGRPVPLAGVIINQVDILGNRIEARRIAEMIEHYQDEYPGAPVYLVGHSGGGGMAVFAAESLPPGRMVDGLVLLSASVSANYDLSEALKHTRHGIVNFYNEDDVALLAVGTTILGNMDRLPGPSAGLQGFKAPFGADPQSLRSYDKLYQVRLTAQAGAGDPHTAATHPGFVQRNVAPWVSGASWPP